MRKVVIAACLTALFVAAAKGDKLILTDGREFEGTVTVEEKSVLIVLEYARLRFPKEQVRSIVFKDLPKVELAKRLAAARQDDPDELFAVAKWAIGAGLQNEAEKIIADVLEINPNHIAARTELGHIKIDGKWHPFDKAVELARSKLEAGQLDLLLDEVLPKLERLVVKQGKEQELAVYDLLAQTELRSKKFTAATQTYARLAKRAEGDAAFRYAGIAEILRDNADGMYVLEEPYPPDSRLLGKSKAALPAGPASLSNPLALEAALRDRAKREIRAGQDFMAEARKVESSDAAMAHIKYQQAARVFERADALVEDIARSYRVEIIRRRIGIIRKSCDDEARKFDAMVQALGQQPISTAAYRQKLSDMIRRMDNIRAPLKEILALAKPYPEDLFLEMQWAESDLKKIKAIRDVLAETLNAKG